MDQVKFFKGCLPQILLGPFLNTLSHLSIDFSFFLLQTASLANFLLVNRAIAIVNCFGFSDSVTSFYIIGCHINTNMETTLSSNEFCSTESGIPGVLICSSCHTTQAYFGWFQKKYRYFRNN